MKKEQDSQPDQTNDQDDIVMPKKKSGGKQKMSPIRQVMKAVTSYAVNPPKKKSAKKPVKAPKADKLDDDGDLD